MLAIDLAELWEYRELAWILAWRNLASRYRLAVLGGLWALIKPIGNTIVLSLFLGHLARIPTEGLPYPLFALVGILIWQYIASIVATACDSASFGDLLSKVYFPRLILPISITIPPAVDLAIASLALVLAMCYFGIGPDKHILWLPAFLLLSFVTALGAACWSMALSIRYADAQNVIPYFMNLWLLASPIYYPAALVPADWRLLYFCNPAAGALSGCRWALLGHGEPPGPEMTASAISATVLLLSGAFFFKFMSKKFADSI